MAHPTDPGAQPPASMAGTPGITPGQAPGMTPGGVIPQPDNGAPPDTRVGTIPGDTTLVPIQEVRSSGRRPSILGAPQGPDIKGHDPVLFTDIEGMYLARLYPGHFADAGNAAADAAIEQGRRVQEQGRELIADQQMPVNWDVEGSHRPASGPGPGGEQAGRPWDEQEAQRRGREARGQHAQQTEQQRQQEEPRQRHERERHEREQHEQEQKAEREKRGGKEA